MHADVVGGAQCRDEIKRDALSGFDSSVVRIDGNLPMAASSSVLKT
jgi:hypothetical protein